jgi:hypothetical protein
LYWLRFMRISILFCQTWILLKWLNLKWKNVFRIKQVNITAQKSL